MIDRTRAIFLVIATFTFVSCASVNDTTRADDQGTTECKPVIATVAEPPTKCVKADGPPPKIGHVFLIVLENKSYDQTMGPNADAHTYLADLRRQGVTLQNYFGIGHNSLDNYIAMVSGQPPNPLTQMDCPVFAEFIDLPTGKLTKKLLKLSIPASSENEQVSADEKDSSLAKVRRLIHQELRESSDSGPTQKDLKQGIGCVYPPTVSTIADQLEPNRSWRAYMEDMDLKQPCQRPKLNHFDDTYRKNNRLYATRHNPFAYFSSLTGDFRGESKSHDQLLRTLGQILVSPDRESESNARDQSKCANHERELSALGTDLREEGGKLPSLIFITPNLCNDGHTDCDQHGEKGEMGAINQFLTTWIPQIQKSDAYNDGVVIITFDEAEVPPAFLYRPDIDSLGEVGNRFDCSCCDERSSALWTNPGITGPGGGRIGAIVLSPFVCPGMTNSVPYNHYSLLRSIEDMFGIRSHLGFADQSDLVTFQEGKVFDYRESAGKEHKPLASGH